MPCNSCPEDAVSCSREAFFKERIQAILSILACQYPSLFIKADLWRPKVVSTTGDFSDEDPEVWIRLGEQVDAFMLVQQERFFQADVGIINQTNRYLLIAEGYGLHPDDHVIVRGEAWLISEVTDQMGISKLRLDKTKERFKRPGRSVPTYREIGMKAAIL